MNNDFPPKGIVTPHDGERWVANEKVDGTLFGILVPPTDQIKRNKKKQELHSECVAAYRHKRVERCLAGITGFVLFDRFSHLPKPISFLKRNFIPENEECWGDMKLFSMHYGTANKAYKNMMRDASVSKWLKVTHLR